MRITYYTIKFGVQEKNFVRILGVAKKITPTPATTTSYIAQGISSVS